MELCTHSPERLGGMMRDPLWMEGDDIALEKPDYDLNSVDDEEDDDGVDPDRLHDGFYDD